MIQIKWKNGKFYMIRFLPNIKKRDNEKKRI
jgi:hypothetical protein